MTEEKTTTEIREMNYGTHPRMDMYILRREEQHLLELRHEEEMLRREELAHLETIKILQKDLKQIRMCIENKEVRYKSHFQATHRHERYNPLPVEIMRRERLAERRSPVNELGDIQVIHYPDQSRPDENRRSTSPTIIPSPSETKSPKLIGNSSVPSFMLPGQQTNIFPMMSRSSKGPPMKTCTSCKHSIHRNAPVCPICKSKSHSKNPKKRKSSE